MRLFAYSQGSPEVLKMVSVTGGGYGPLNWLFLPTQILQNGKPYYSGQRDPNRAIKWFDGKWGIYDFGASSAPIYYSEEDVLFPWQVTTWLSQPSYEPAPAVNKGS